MSATRSPRLLLSLTRDARPSGVNLHKMEGSLQRNQCNNINVGAITRKTLLLPSYYMIRPTVKAGLLTYHNDINVYTM
jgi:hypothetical protein